MACGAGLPVLALATTVGHFIIMLAFLKLITYLPDERRTANLRIVYEDRGDRLQTISLPAQPCLSASTISTSSEEKVRGRMRKRGIRLIV